MNVKKILSSNDSLKKTDTVYWDTVIKDEDDVKDEEKSFTGLR